MNSYWRLEAIPCKFWIPFSNLCRCKVNIWFCECIILVSYIAECQSLSRYMLAKYVSIVSGPPGYTSTSYSSKEHRLKCRQSNIKVIQLAKVDNSWRTSFEGLTYWEAAHCLQVGYLCWWWIFEFPHASAFENSRAWWLDEVVTQMTTDLCAPAHTGHRGQASAQTITESAGQMRHRIHRSAVIFVWLCLSKHQADCEMGKGLNGLPSFVLSVR